MLSSMFLKIIIIFLIIVFVIIQKLILIIIINNTIFQHKASPPLHGSHITHFIILIM